MMYYNDILNYFYGDVVFMNHGEPTVVVYGLSESRDSFYPIIALTYDEVEAMLKDIPIHDRIFLSVEL